MLLGCSRSEHANNAEIAVLCHQLAVLRHQVIRPEFRPVGAENSSASCDLGIFMDEPAQPVDPVGARKSVMCVELRVRQGSHLVAMISR